MAGGLFLAFQKEWMHLLPLQNCFLEYLSYGVKYLPADFYYFPLDSNPIIQLMTVDDLVQRSGGVMSLALFVPP